MHSKAWSGLVAIALLPGFAVAQVQPHAQPGAGIAMRVQPEREDIPERRGKTQQQLPSTAPLNEMYLPGIGASVFEPSAQRGVKADRVRGIVVGFVTDGSPLAEMGVKPGDFIAAVDDRQTQSTTELASLLSQHQTGDSLTLQIVKFGEGTKSQRWTVPIQLLSNTEPTLRKRPW